MSPSGHQAYKSYLIIGLVIRTFGQCPFGQWTFCQWTFCQPVHRGTFGQQTVPMPREVVKAPWQWLCRFMQCHLILFFEVTCLVYKKIIKTYLLFLEKQPHSGLVKPYSNEREIFISTAWQCQKPANPGYCSWEA